MHPRLFQLGRFIVPTDGVLVALGVVAAFILCIRIARHLSLDSGKIANLALLAIVTALLSAKLVLAALLWGQYGVRSLMAEMTGTQAPILTGIALAVILAWLYGRRVGLPLRRSADALAPALALGSAVASIGCLESGCGYGTPTNQGWAIIFRSPYCAPGTPLGVPLHPTQIYAGLADFALFVFLLWLVHRPHRDGEVAGAWLFLGGLSSFFLMSLRGDVSDGMLFGGFLAAAQLPAVVMVLCGGALWLRREPALETQHAA